MQVVPAEAGRDLLGLQAVAPVERAGLVLALRVQRLHRGGDALRREPGQLGVAQRLDVLDAVRGGAVAARGAVGVERRGDGAVADRVRRALEAGAGEAGDDLGVAVGIRPERLRALAVRAGLEQPRRARVDHAVDEELRGARAPAAPAASRSGELALDLLVGDAGLLLQRDDAAQR